MMKELELTKTVLRARVGSQGETETDIDAKRQAFGRMLYLNLITKNIFWKSLEELSFLGPDEQYSL